MILSIPCNVWMMVLTVWVIYNQAKVGVELTRKTEGTPPNLKRRFGWRTNLLRIAATIGAVAYVSYKAYTGN